MRELKFKKEKVRKEDCRYIIFYEFDRPESPKDAPKPEEPGKDEPSSDRDS